MKFVNISAKVKVPGPKTPPKHISKKGEKQWAKFYKKYGVIIRKGKTPEDKWATAIAIWRNYSTKHKFAPFDDKASYLNQEAQDYMENRLIKNRKTLFKKAGSLLKKMNRKGLVQRVYKERISSVVYDKPDYLITSQVIVSFKKDIEKEVQEALKTAGFKKRKDIFTLSIGNHKITCNFQENNRFILFVNMYYTPQHIKFVLGLKDSDLEDKKKIIKLLSKKVKDILKKEALDNTVLSFIQASSAMPKDIVFDKPLSEEQLNILMETVKNITSMDTDILKTQYGLEEIQSLGNPIYQFNIVKNLIKILESRSQEVPKLWKAILKDPNHYLNPDIQKLKDKEENDDPDIEI